MFSKIVLTSLIIGVISVNALTIPVARSPAPELECESPLLFSTVPYHDLTSVSFNSFVAMEQGPHTPPRARGPGFPPPGTLGPVHGWTKPHRRHAITSTKRGGDSCASQRHRGRGQAWAKPQRRETTT